MFLVLLIVSLLAAAALRKRCFANAGPGMAGIATAVLWLCLLIVPMQAGALLQLLGLTEGLPTTVNLLAASVAVMVLARGWRLLPLDLSSWRFPRDRHILAGLALVAGLYMVMAAKMTLIYPDDWDATAYHYPMALRWLHESSLRITPTTDWRESLPGNFEILEALLLAGGHEKLLGLAQWPGLAVFGLAVYQLALRLSGSETAAWAVLSTALTIPIVAFQSTSGYVDLFGSAMLLGALALLLDHRCRTAPVILAGLACGLAMGAKPVFWLHALVLAANAAALLWPRPDRWRAVGVFAAGIAVPSSFWFLRATVCTGNPFYPIRISLGPLQLPGFDPGSITDPLFYLEHVRHWAEWFVYPWVEWKAHPGYLLQNYTSSDGLGAAFATFAMPGAAYAVWLAWRDRPDLRPWLWNTALMALLWWTALHKFGRFGLPLFLLLTLLSAPLFALLENRATKTYRVLYVLALAATVSISAFFPALAIVQTARTGVWTRTAQYGYPKAIDSLPPGSRLVWLCDNYSDSAMNHALAGQRLTNRVVPDWHVPERLTREFLDRWRVDYVAEKLVRDNRKDAPAAGLALLAETRLPGARWRIWKVASKHSHALQ